MTRLYRLGQFVRGLVALVALTALLAGVPYALVRFVGWPLPRRVPSWHQFTSALGQHGISDTALIDVLAIVLWVAWAMLTLAVFVEALTMAHSRERTRVVIAGHLQPFAGALLGAIVFSLAASFARSGGSGVPMPRAAVVVPLHPPNASNGAMNGNASDAYLTAAVTRRAPLSNGSANGAAPTNRAIPIQSREMTYVVRDGDTLWSIAADRLGDAARWPMIFEANRGVPQRDGGSLDNPHWIYPGWVLRLPEDASPAPAPVPARSVPSHPSSKTTPAPTPMTTVPATPTGPMASPSSGTATRAEPTPPTNGRPVGAHEPNQGQTGAPDARQHEQPVELASGARVGGALVAAILGALVALRLRRRQRYRPRAPRQGRHLGPPALTPALRDLLAKRRAAVDPDQEWSVSAGPERAPLTGIPSEEAFAVPDRIEVGTTPAVGMGSSDEEIVELSLGSWPGLTLSGPGAESVLRAVLAALLARSGPYDVQIVTTTRCADRLLPGLDLTLSITQRADAEAVCESVERAIVARARQFEEDDVVDAAAFRARFPAEPFPLLVALVDEVSAKSAGRWWALAEEAPRLGATVIALSTERDQSFSAATPRLVVATDGQIEEATPPALAAVLGLARLFQLGADEAADLLAPVAAVHNYVGPEDEPGAEDRPPEDREPDDRNADDRFSATGATGKLAVESHDRTHAEGSPRADDLAAIVLARQREEEMMREAWPEPRPLPVRDVLVPDVAVRAGTPSAPSGLAVEVEPEEVSTEPASPPVRVKVLGPPLIEAFGVQVTKGLRQTAFELLAWFALRPEGAPLEMAADALWPGVSTRRGHERFWTALGNLRTRLGKPEGSEEDPLDLVAKLGERYVPDPAVLDVDLWRFEASLADATRAHDPEPVADALGRALASYGGDFAVGTDELWSEPAREDLHRRALDAACRLAGLREEAGQTDEAVDAFGHATRIDPVNEEAHRRLIALLGRLGRLDEALSIGAALKARLDEADLDPEPATDAMLASLRRRQQRAASRRSFREEPSSGGASREEESRGSP